MTEKTAIVTGASAGVGKAAAKQLLDSGWRVIGVGRDPQRCAAAAAELANPRFTMLSADLSSMRDTARLAGEIAALAPKIDALCNNAGGVQAEQRMTAEGFEVTWAANHLAPYLLTRLLLPCLGPGSRVIATSSDGHAHCPAINWDDLNFADGWNSGGAYCQAKLANVLFARELARRFGPQGLIAHALHPGVVDSNFASHCEPEMQVYMKSILHRSVTPEHAARTLAWLASGEVPGQVNGRYFTEMAEVPAAPAALDDAAALRLWEVSEALTLPYMPNP
jgi:NAD(P)-dependent dehydrogenase (short-subunit alcohol dehydrogenase family)